MLILILVHNIYILNLKINKSHDDVYETSERQLICDLYVVWIFDERFDPLLKYRSNFVCCSYFLLENFANC